MGREIKSRQGIDGSIKMTKYFWYRGGILEMFSQNGTLTQN
jgi:hypothetical protein